MGLGYNGKPFKIKLVDLSDNTTVAHAPTSNTQTLQPPSGKIYQILAIYYSAADPAGSGAGTHDIKAVYQNFSDQNVNMFFKITGNTGTDISIKQHVQFTGDAEYPSGTAQQFDLMSKGLIWCSYEQPIDFIYTNSTDVDQTGTRTLEIMVKEFDGVI